MPAIEEKHAWTLNCGACKNSWYSTANEGKLLGAMDSFEAGPCAACHAVLGRQCPMAT